MAHAIANSYRNNEDPEEFTIRRGSAFVNEYPRIDKTGQRNDGGPSNPNHLLGCFPTLFPYGRGGIEASKNTPSYETHVRWTMEYADHRFRKDPQYPFQVFGVMQKREVCRSAVIQMRKKHFNKNMALISTLTNKDMEKASQEEAQGIGHSNPAMRALRQEMRAIRTRVKGSDESRTSVRYKIWATNLQFNPPIIWLTINPSDTNDPIAQVLTGEEIDLDAFCNTAGPDGNQRAMNIANDPFASAQYFHLIVKTVFEELFGISKSGHGRIRREYGILGKLQSYIGTVEAQGRGTLHLHTLIWLKDAPTAHELKAALKTERFRIKVIDFISTCIRADLSQRTNSEVLEIPKETGISYSRPVDPTDETAKSVREERLARALQYHKCTTAACLKVVKSKLVCKRRAPFDIAIKDWVDEEGNWGPKRWCEFLNSWNPTILRSIRSNHDIKLVMSGKETSTITYYITHYATKKQERSTNVSALLADSLAFTQTKQRNIKDIKRYNKLLIQRCANSLQHYREFSAPEVVSYIMGWPEVYESHHYVTLFWDSVVECLKKQYPGLGDPYK